MQHYDRGWRRADRGYDFAHGYGTVGRNAGRNFTPDYYRGWDATWGRTPSAGFREHGTGLYRQWGTPAQAPRYDRGYRGGYDRGYDRGFGGGYRGERGVYGGDYPGLGGYPGGPRGGYDRGYAQQPFLPEDAYRRHPEYDRPQTHRAGRWPEVGHDLDARDEPLEDSEIETTVRESLQSDHWIDADRIEVRVNDGVATLTGEVDDYLEARYAWDDAWEAAGVRGVVNQITVRTARQE